MASKTSPEISVLMSVYNDILYLKDAVESILNQSYGNFEFIIVNDGSTDGSLELLKEYNRQDDRIVLFDESNKGLTKELQFALKHVRGNYVARMDGDDIAMLHRFEHQLQYMKRNPDIVCSGADVLFIDEDNDPFGYSKQKKEHKDIEKQLFKGRGGAIYHPTMIAQTEAVKKIGGYNEKYRIGQDLDLFLKLGELGKLGNSKEVTLKFRRYHKSTTALESESSGKARREEIITEALKRRGNRDGGREKIKVKTHPPQNKFEYHFAMSKKALRSGFLKVGFKHLFISMKNFF